MYTTQYKGYYITGRFDSESVTIVCRDHSQISASSITAAKKIINRLISEVNEYA